MPYSEYPGATDLQALLIAAKVFPATIVEGDPLEWLDLPLKAEAARDWFEEQVGRRMLAVSGTRTFDSPYPALRLDLRADLASLASLTVDGSAKVVNTDFYLKPDNADADGKPYRWVQFANYLPDKRRSIVVVGLWGYGAEIPAAAWNAILAQAFVLCGPEIGGNKGEGLRSWTAGDEKRDFGDAGAYSAELLRAEARVQSALDIYRDVRVG